LEQATPFCHCFHILWGGVRTRDTLLNVETAMFQVVVQPGTVRTAHLHPHLLSLVFDMQIHPGRAAGHTPHRDCWYCCSKNGVSVQWVSLQHLWCGTKAVGQHQSSLSLASLFSLLSPSPSISELSMLCTTGGCGSLLWSVPRSNRSALLAPCLRNCQVRHVGGVVQL
jgi:hypothetical protein